MTGWQPRLAPCVPGMCGSVGSYPRGPWALLLAVFTSIGRNESASMRGLTSRPRRVYRMTSVSGPVQHVGLPGTAQADDVLGWCAQLPGRRAGGAVRLGGEACSLDLLRNEAVLAKGAFP